ncbi:MAG: signal peptidase I [Clostridia bacterium]|jgi:signal peptidase|nr:signal peptidase I [Clostridia bacterium]
MKTKSKLKLVGKIAFYGVFAAVLIIVLMMFFSKLTNKVFFLGDRTVVWILTDSMEEEIPPSTYIVVKKAKPEDVNTGDVITFYSDDPALGGALNTHRVIEIIDGGREFVTKGDNSLDKDPFNASGAKLVGIYQKKSPILTALGRFFATPAGIFVTLALIILLTLGVYLPEILKKKKDDKPPVAESEGAAAAVDQTAKQETALPDEEEIKRRAIEEYLKAQKESEQSDSSQDSEHSENN